MVDFRVSVFEVLCFEGDVVFGWNGFGEKDGAADDGAVSDDGVSAEDGGVCVDGDIVFDGGVSFCASDELSFFVFWE